MINIKWLKSHLFLNIFQRKTKYQKTETANTIRKLEHFHLEKSFLQIPFSINKSTKEDNKVILPTVPVVGHYTGKSLEKNIRCHIKSLYK